MAPLDWGELMELDPKNLGDEMDDLDGELVEFDPGKEKDPIRLKKLFQVTQAILIYKGMQCEIAEEKMAEMAEQQGKMGARRDQNIDTLQSELQALERENKNLRMSGGTGEGMGGTRFMRQEMSEMERQIGLQARDLQDKERQLLQYRRTVDEYEAKFHNVESELKELRAEKDNLLEEVRDYDSRLALQRETMLSRRDDDAESRDKLRDLNAQLSELLNENEYLQGNMKSKERDLEEMKEELKQGRIEINKTTDQNDGLKGEVSKSEKENARLRREVEMLKELLKDVSDQAKNRYADDDVMLEEKVQEWQVLLYEREDRINHLEMEKVELKEQLIASNMDGERASVAMLTKALAEKDEQIKTLQARVQTCADDLGENDALMQAINATLTKGGAGLGDKQVKKIGTLQTTLKHTEHQLKEADDLVKDAEKDARQKDKQLSEALERMRQYESGEYGLPEAVAEIKENKLQVAIRDRQIEDLTQYINKEEMRLNDLADEVEELRERLGLDPKEPMDMTEFNKKKKIRQQEDRALNNILQKEVERLEDERLQLKQKIRQLAKATGHKAVAMGLTADDMVAVDNYIDELKEKRLTATASDIKHESETDAIRIKNIQLDEDLDKQGKKAQKIMQENAEFKLKLAEVESENIELEKGLREIDACIAQLNKNADGDEQIIKCPTLEKMLTAIEAKNLVGRYDTSLYLKAQVDNLTGHNEELRKELKDARFEATCANVKLDRAKGKLETVESEVVSLREAGAGGYFQAISLPGGMTPSSSDVIASLNEHLVQTLHELSSKEAMVVRIEEAVELYKTKLAVIRHQQGLCYEEYIRDKNEWESARDRLQADLDKVQGQREEDKTRLQEFDNMLDTLSQDDVEVRRRLQDLTRKITVLRVNEKALTRRYTGLQDINTRQTKEVTKTRNDMIQMESAVAERLGYLQRHKDMATFKIAALQKNLDQSVPVKDLDNLTKKYTNMTEKYRDILERSNSLVVSNEQSAGFEAEIKRLETESAVLKQELSVEKEKLHALEAAFENMRKQGMMNSASLRDHDVISISHKLTTLEMKELNERQRADHATHMYEQQKVQLRSLEDRNFELEQKYSEITKLNLTAQKVEHELRDELSTCVSQAVSDADRRRISALEKSEATLKNEVSVLKDIADVASHQVSSLDSQQVSHEKENISLRQQLLDFQCQSDEKTIIGKLHRHIVQLQVSEGTAVRKLQDQSNKITKVEAMLLRTEQKLDEKNQTIYHNRLESRAKTRHLKQTIQDLRYKYSGSIPLQQQERFSQSMVELQEDKAKLEADLQKTNNERIEVEDQLAALKLKHTGIQELIATLKDSKGAEKVVEWHEKLEQIRLSELKTKRQMSRLRQQITFLEGVIKKHEQEVLGMEEEKIRLTKSFEDRELSWEQREVELERVVVSMERQQAAIASAASQFESATGNIPDPSLSVATQLEQAIATIKANVKLILDAKAESHASKTRMDELEKELRDKERELTIRDKVITDLRLRLPATADRDKVFNKITEATSGTKFEEDYEGKQAVQVAQSTVYSLQKRLAHKDEAIHKYEEMLKDARQETQLLISRHDDELRNMQAKLHSKHDSAFKQFKSDAMSSVTKPYSKGPTNDQLRKLNQLEDIVADQDNSIAAMRDKLSQARQDIKDWKYKYEDAVRQYAEDKDSLMGDHQDQITLLEQKMSKLMTDLSEKSQALMVTEKELESQKEANVRAPTTTMKQLVERLKNQLALKEKQHQALSKALRELRADMVTQAKADVVAHANQSEQEFNVQKVVDKQTKILQEQVEDLENQIQKLKKEVKKSREHENSMNEDLEEARHEINKKETYVRKIKDDKSRLEREVEDLENKIRRMNTMSRQRGMSDDSHKELEDLKRRNKSLQEELKKSKHQAEKPYEQQANKGQGEEAVARWEESKKWQKMVEKMKSRLKDKDSELDRVHKAHELSKHALERANKDKDNLERRIRQESKILPLKAEPVTSDGSKRSNHQLEELKQRNYQLEDQLGALQRQLSVGHDKAFEEIQLRNKFLTERLEELESLAGQRSQNVDPLISARTYKDLADKESKLQKEVLRLSEENIELRFEVEQMRHDVPRLKSRVDDLQKYVDILKAEKEQLQIMNSSARSQSTSLSSTVSNIRRIGESGRSTRELEKTIALLKKVVEKTQLENEQLKKAPGIVTQDQMRMLKGENQGLKDQLDDLRSRMGATLSDRYVHQQKGTAKVVADHEKIRKDLMKEMDNNEQLRIQVRQQELNIEQLRRELDEARAKLVDGGDGSIRPSAQHSTMDGKGWKTGVASRMYEGKVKALEEEVQKKNKMLTDVKVLLRDAVDREQTLSTERNQLQHQVEVLERVPQWSKGESTELVQEFQMSRLTIDRLENEKSELQHQLKLQQQHLGIDGNGEDLMRKAHQYEKLKSEMTEYKTKHKAAALEIEQQRVQITKLRRELSNFGPDFFEEIEDLKYNYREALQKNIEYEEQLRQFSKQFGIDLDLPDTPS